VVREVTSPIKIKKGFLSSSFLKANFLEVKKDLRKHSQGKALELTWNDWDSNTALQVANELFSHVGDVKIILNMDSKTIFIGRGYEYSSIIELVNGLERIVRK
jgi:hypothetical protein